MTIFLKKSLAVILALICAMSLAVAAFAENALTSGQCGDKAFWSFNEETGTLTISGEGEMNDYIQSYYEPWAGYLDSITTVKIEDGVTGIGDCAFIDCTALTDITIPSSVTNIGYDAFYNTGYYNNSENWEYDVLYIDNYLIRAAENFDGDYNVKDGTVVIAEAAFKGIGTNPFSITVPGSVKGICDNAFENSALKSVKVGEGTISIGDGAFCYTEYLETVEFPTSIEYVGFDIFYGSAFAQAEENYDENGVMYINKCLICIKGVTLPEVYEVSEGTKVIADGSLGGLYSETKEIVLPESVVTIGNSAFGWDIYGHFACGELTKIDLSHLKNLKYIGDDAFNGCAKLKEIIIPDSVEYIGDSAFRGCSSIESIKIPDGISKINGFTFLNCENLKKITFYASVKEIAWGAFDLCESLTDVYFVGTEDQWKEIYIDYINDALLNAKIHFVEKEEICRVNSVSINDFSMSYKTSSKLEPSIDADADVDYTISYSSSDESVVKVNANGDVKATGKGNATIIVTVTDEHGNRVTDTCNVEVKYTSLQWFIIIVLFGWIWY